MGFELKYNKNVSFFQLQFFLFFSDDITQMIKDQNILTEMNVRELYTIQWYH